MEVITIHGMENWHAAYLKFRARLMRRVLSSSTWNERQRKRVSTLKYVTRFSYKKWLQLNMMLVKRHGCGQCTATGDRFTAGW